MGRKLGLGLTAGYAVIFLTLLAFGFGTYWNITELAESEGWVAHTYEVLDALESTLSSLKDTQNGYRGYHATGDVEFARPYREARDKVPGQIDHVVYLTSDNLSQQRRLADFRPVAESILAYYGRGIDVRRDKGFAESAEFIKGGAGNAEMARAREMIAEMREEERTLLERRTKTSHNQYIIALVTTAASVFMGLLLTATALVLTVRDRRQREESAAQLRAANDALEQHVLNRTAALQASTRKLEESNRELEQFATVASHDLQEPLRKIQAFSDRLREVSGPLLQGQGQEYLGRIVSSAGRMRTLIDDLLSFSRVTRKGQPFVPTDLTQVATEVVSDLEGRLRDTGGRVEVGAMPTLQADPTQIRQLLQNLIANALKFRKPDEPPIVKVQAEVLKDVDGVAGPACRLTVADNGVGFEQIYAERIFQMFQRLHGRSQYEGNGIGLAICRKIVERHHGAISATSQPDLGTTFCVTLPLEQTTLE